ncbi:MAG TPA: TonB-dependent receptor [Terracidiphilus sp.]|nr:TonB-dependent receptor [Terracidiphilus sp.]
MKYRPTRSVFAILLLATMAITARPVAILGQTFRGAISGTVTDQSGAVVAGAAVEAMDMATGVTHETISSSGGEYSFQDLPLGAYTVTARASGFKEAKFANVPVTAGVIYTLPVKLSVQSTGETVEVSASGLALDTTSTTQTTDIPEVTVQDIPLNGRDFTQMIGLAPGFAGYSLGGYGSVNGTRANQINWQIDGSDNNDWWHNIPAVNQGGVENIAGVTLPIDSIAEFSLQTQSSSEVGRNPGGTVNLVTKSGTNNLHGSLYYYERNQALAESNPFNTLGDLPLSNIQWGASLGGPFWKDHTFWFANFEKQKFNIATGNSGVEPNAGYQAAALALLKQYGVAEDAATANLISLLWPANLLTPTALTAVQSPAPEFGYSYNGVIKVDHNFSAKHNISGRAFLGQGNQTAPVGETDINPWYFEIAPIHVYNYSADDNYVISPSMTNSVTIGVNYFNQVFSDAKTDFSTVPQAGFVTGSRFPNNAPNIKISGFEPTGNTPPEGRNDITGHIDEALNWIVGKQQLRLGGEYRQMQLNEFYWRHSIGSFTFDTTYPSPWDGNTAIDSKVRSLANFMAGYMTKATQAFGDPERTVYSHAFDVFAQDSYQISPTFNVNFGLRYDFMQPMHDSKKDLSVFRPGTTPTAIAFQGKDIGNVYDPDATSFSPRIGFSWQPKSSPSTVVRGGAGLFFDMPNANPFLDNRPGNSAPNGFEGNPGGSNPVVNPDIGNEVIVTGKQIIPTPSNTNPCPIDSPCGAFSVAKGFRSPYNVNFSVQIERSLGGKAMMQIGYVGSEGRKLLSLLDINQPIPNGTLNAAPGPYSGIPTSGTTCTFGGNCYSDINQIQSIGTSNYSSLQAIFRTTSWHGVTSQLSYTWGHNLDEVTAYRGALPQNSYNFKGDYGNSDFDTRNSVVGYLNYDVPALPGPKALTGGWALNTAYSFKGGQPITVYTATDSSGTNEDEQRPNQVGNPLKGISHKIVNPGDGSTPYVQWLNTNAYAQPADGTWGNVARNNVFGPGFADFDFSVFKNTKFEVHDFPVNTQFRAEMYNLFNRVNLASPACTQLCLDYWDGSSDFAGAFGTTSSTIGSGNFSPGIGPGEPFNVQLALKIIF